MRGIKEPIIILCTSILMLAVACSRPTIEDLEQRYGAALRKGDFPEALSVAQKQLTAVEKEFTSSSPQYASTLNKLGLVELRLRELKQAEAHHESAIHIYESLYSREHETVARSLGYLSQVYHAQGRIDWAIETSQRSLEIYIRIFGAKHFLTASQMNTLALLYQHSGKLVPAQLLFARALDSLRYNMAPSNPAIAAVSNNLERVTLLLTPPAGSQPEE